MTLLRSPAWLVLAISLGCSADAPEQPAAAPTPTAQAGPHAVTPEPAPHGAPSPDDPHAAMMARDPDAPPPLVPSAKGSIEATIDGTKARFRRLPPGQNRAVVTKGVQRVTLAAEEDDSGWPHLRLSLEGFRPDETSYPKTLSSQGKRPDVSLRYEVNENRVYKTKPAEGVDVEVTLESYYDTTLTGRFEGKIAPTAAGLGDAIAVEGRFSVALGLRGVEPGPPAPPAADAAPDAKAEPATPAPQPPL